MFAIFLTLFVLVCLVLMVVVLLQSSKGGGLAGAFGGAGSDTSVLGGRGAATFLSKVTVYLAVSFMCLALLLAILSSRARDNQSGGGIVDDLRESGGINDVYQVEDSGSIYEEIQTEGFVPAEEATTTEEAPAQAPAEGEASGEPAPAGG
jgi:preprotein translocase subunit SecG